MLQDYASNSADGWSMALTSVRDLLAEGDLRPDEVGGDFAGEATRLGRTVGSVHSELARALGTSRLDAAGVRGVADWMLARLDDAARAVPEVAERRAAITAVLEGVTAADGLVVQRIHGDLHLGQELRTPRGWLVIDFEGEPSRPLDDRVRPDSPLRDVAAMLRSFDYAAFHQLAEWEPGAESPNYLQRRAQEWADRNRAAFCDGYAEVTGSDPRAAEAVLRAYELDKAVYEVLYETRNRPNWLAIPLRSMERLIDRS
jgi:maltokinase